MELTVLDWLFVAFLIGIEPFLGIRFHRRVGDQVAAGVANARVGHYRHIILLEWGLLLLVLLLWGASGRGWSQLGLGFPVGTGTWVGMGVALAASAFLVLQWLGLRGDEEKLREMYRQYRSIRAMMPEDDRDRRWFGAVSVTAGICEEVVYRGFLLGVASALGGVWIGILVSSLVFGLGHAYQGPAGMLRVAGIGLALAGITVLTGSLWAAMLIHAVLDITSGLLAQRALRVGEPEPDELQATA